MPRISQLLKATAPLRGEALTKLIDERRGAFSRRFEEMFALQKQSCEPTSGSRYKRSKAEAKYPACGDDGKFTEHSLELGKTALSQVTGRP